MVHIHGEQAVELHGGDTAYTPDYEERRRGTAHDTLMTNLSIAKGAPRCGSYVRNNDHSVAGTNRTR